MFFNTCVPALYPALISVSSSLLAATMNQKSSLREDPQFVSWTLTGNILKIRELLKPDGYAFIHCIGRMSQPGTTGPFIRKYIFPGAYVPALCETFAATERGLWCDDMEVLRLHYRYTVKHWRERFAKNRARAASIYDEGFCRMWEFYLAAVELEFLHGSHMVFQLLLSTKRDAVPIMRDFMVDSERVAWTKLAG